MSTKIEKYYNTLFREQKDNTEGLFNQPSKHFIELLSSGNKSSHLKYALDLGYGYGNYSIYLAQSGYHVDCIDIIDPSIFKSRLQNSYSTLDKINIICCDIKEYILSQTYDFVVCKDVLHYLSNSDIKIILNKIYNHCSKNAVVYLVIFADIIRRNKNGEIYTFESEANLSSNNLIELINEIFSDWKTTTYFEEYKEAEKYNTKYKYYFEATKITFILQNIKHKNKE